MKRCTLCDQEKDCRPYGVGCAMVCFSCMKAQPGLEQVALDNFGLQLEAAGPVVVLGGEVGPYPFEHACGARV